MLATGRRDGGCILGILKNRYTLGVEINHSREIGYVGNLLMIGSVSFPGFELQTEFSNKLEILSQYFSDFGYQSLKTESNWQNLEKEKRTLLEICKVIFYHTKFKSEIYYGKRKKVLRLRIILKLLFTITRDFFTLRALEFESKHISHFLLNKYITDKHLNLICNFLNSSAIYLFVCENDIDLKTNPQTQLQEIIRIAECSEKPLFINISNNSSFTKASDYFGGKKKNFLNFSNWNQIDFFINGSASYLLNKQMASIIYDFIVRNPSYRYCSIDWLYSLIGRKYSSDEVICLIPVKEFIGNGSKLKTKNS